jgi:hypothetical protein
MPEKGKREDLKLDSNKKGLVNTPKPAERILHAVTKETTREKIIKKLEAELLISKMDMKEQVKYMQAEFSKLKDELEKEGIKFYSELF